MSALLTKIVSLLLAPMFAFVGYFSPTQNIPDYSLDIQNLQSTVENLGGTNQLPTTIALFSSSLQASITATANSFTLTSATYNNGASTLASSTYGFIIDEGNSNQEIVVADCTGVNCTNVTRGIDRLSGTTSVPALMFSHRRGASVKITDGPQLMILTQMISTLAGAADATTGVKGVVEIATQTEVASSTGAGGTSATVVIPASNATDTPNTDTRASRVIVSDMLGYIKQGWLNLAEQWNFSSAAITNASTTNLSIGTRAVPAPYFGGTGTDGALAITSGTTTFALGSTSVFEKNYSSIEISGSGAIDFSSVSTSTSGVVVVLRSLGDCTITGASNQVINLRGLGGGVGTGGKGHSIGDASTQGGPGGGGGGSTASGGVTAADHTGGAVSYGIGGNGGVQLFGLSSSTARNVPPGGNGGPGGSGTSGTGGLGGRGGGALYLECGGTLTFTTGRIDASGQAGYAASGTNGGGGGGGAGGNIVMVARELGTITGSTTSSGAAGGAGVGGLTTASGRGGEGSTLILKNVYQY